MDSDKSKKNIKEPLPWTTLDTTLEKFNSYCHITTDYGCLFQLEKQIVTATWQ